MSKDPLVAGNANLVPCVTNANNSLSAQPTSGGGGGGGGSGPNLNVSTITVNSSGGIELNEPGYLQLDYAGGAGATITIQTDPTGAGNTYQLLQAYPANGQPVPFATPIPSLIDNNGNFGTLQVSGIAFDGNGQGSSAPGAYIRADPTGRLEAFATDFSISSITVSSINGAAPGGGGSANPNPVVSTLTVNDSGRIIFNTQLLMKSSGNGQVQVTTGGSDTSLAVQSSDGNAVVYLGAANGMSGGYITTAYNQPLNILPSTIISTLTVSTLNSGSLGTLAVGGSMTVFNQLACSAISTNVIAPVSGTNVTIPALLVSSINNAAYPPSAGAYPKISTIGLGGGGSQTSYNSISTNSLAQFTTPFDVVQNHCYEVSWNFQVKPSSAAQFTDFASFATTGVNAGNQVVTVPLASSTLTQAKLFFVGQNTGQTYLTCSTETSFPVELDMNYSTENVNLIDLGVIGTSL